VRLRFFAAEIGHAQAALSEGEDMTLEKCSAKRNLTLLLETREKDQSFPLYNPNAIPLRIRVASPENLSQIVEDCAYPVNAPANLVANYTLIQVDSTGTVEALRSAICAATHIPIDMQRLVRLHHNRAELITGDTASLQELELCAGSVVYCEPKTDSSERSLLIDTFEQSRCQISIEFNHPDEVENDGAPRYAHSLRISRNQTLAALKRQIAPIIGIPEEEFRLKGSANGLQFKDEAVMLDALHLTDGSIVHVERGRPLKKDEFDIRFYYFNPDKGQLNFLFTLPIHKMIKTADLKQHLLTYINEIKPNGKRQLLRHDVHAPSREAQEECGESVPGRLDALQKSSTSGRRSRNCHPEN